MVGIHNRLQIVLNVDSTIVVQIYPLQVSAKSQMIASTVFVDERMLGVYVLGQLGVGVRCRAVLFAIGLFKVVHTASDEGRIAKNLFLGVGDAVLLHGGEDVHGERLVETGIVVEIHDIVNIGR